MAECMVQCSYNWYKFIGRAHSFPQAMEFWARPWNLPLFVEFWYFRGISWNFAEVKKWPMRLGGSRLGAICLGLGPVGLVSSIGPLRLVKTFCEDVRCTYCSCSMHGTRLHKTSRRDTMARYQRRHLLRRDRDILLRDRDEMLVRLETEQCPKKNLTNTVSVLINKHKK